MVFILGAILAFAMVVTMEQDELSITSEDASEAKSFHSRTESEERPSLSSSPYRASLHKSRSIDTSSLKSTPADPQITEANGQSTSLRKFEGGSPQLTTKEHLSTIISDSNPSENSHQRSPSTGFFNNMINSLTFNGIDQERKEPDMITHRREPSVTLPSPTSDSPTSKVLQTFQNPTYDPKLYVDEFFVGTCYRYATTKRNTDFHALFPQIPISDRLLDDFSCALNRDFLIQGRVYITPLHICFNSNLLGWITSLVINIRDIVSIEKTSTAGLFPNGMCFHLEKEKHYFASFISRDTTFNFLEIVWHIAKESEYLTLRPDHLTLNKSQSLNDFITGGVITCPPSRASIADVESTIESAIMSVDDSFPYGGYNNRSKQYLSDDEEDDEECEEGDSDENDYSFAEDALVSDTEEKSVRNVYKLKPGSKFQYDGLHYYRQTEFKYDPAENNETVLAEVDLNAPPGLVYQMMFSEDCSDFILSFLKSQNSTQISEIPGFDQANQEGQYFREYTYAKALNYPVGPKSTKCIVTEHILYCDYDNCINILNTTKTPDVPSGNSFSVKTRYMFKWRDAVTSTLKISYWVDWTGSSWIKSMVDSNVKSGQVEATEKLLSLIAQFMEENVELKPMHVNAYPRKSQPQSRRVSRISRKPSKLILATPEKHAISETNPPLIKENIIIMLLIVIILLLFFISLCQIQIIRKLSKVTNSHDVSVLEEVKQWLSLETNLS